MKKRKEITKSEYTLTAVIYKEDDLYIAKCPQTDTASQGKTVEEALENIQEATELFLENLPLPIDSPPFITYFSVTVPSENFFSSIEEARKDYKEGRITRLSDMK